MKPWSQFIIGGLLLGLCAIIHISILSGGLELVYAADTSFADTHRIARRIAVVLVAFATALAGHAIQIWIWAIVLHAAGAIDSVGNAVYFSLVTSTTLGYGDITLDRNWRIFGALAAVTGLLTFGLSTAFLVGVMGQLFSVRVQI